MAIKVTEPLVAVCRAYWLNVGTPSYFAVKVFRRKMWWLVVCAALLAHTGQRGLYFAALFVF